LVETGLYDDLLKIEAGILEALRVARLRGLDSTMQILNDALRECRNQLEQAARDRPSS
jgi:hypothetical protein